MDNRCNVLVNFLRSAVAEAADISGFPPMHPLSGYVLHDGL